MKKIVLLFHAYSDAFSTICRLASSNQLQAVLKLKGGRVPPIEIERPPFDLSAGVWKEKMTVFARKNR